MEFDINKILKLDYTEIRPFLLKLDEKGLLSKYLPELTDLKGIDYIDGQGHKENFQHTLKVVENTYKETIDERVRLVSILHDIGKKPTKKFIKGQGWTFSMHEQYGATKMLKRIFDRLNINEKYYDFVYKLIYHHGRPKELTKEIITDSALRRFYKEIGNKEDLKLLFLFCKCDITTKFEDKLNRQRSDLDLVYNKILHVIKKDEENKWRCPIDGFEIMNYFGVKGKEIGIIKNKIETAIKSGEIEDNYDAAFEYMKNIKLNYY